MQTRYATHPDDFNALSTADLRERFVVDDLFTANEVTLVYSHHDRMVLGGAVPTAGKPLALTAPEGFKSAFFCERRELAVVGVLGSGSVVVDGAKYNLNAKDVLYIGRGAESIVLETNESSARFYLASATAHMTYPTTLVPLSEALRVEAGETATANERTIYKHLHEDGVRTAQLVLGITALKAGNVWNSMPPHTHDRRTEVYLYMDLPDEHRIQHFMGMPDAPRSVAMRNNEAVVSPSWSVHLGAGTTNYSFVWVMAGENQSFTDMDQVSVVQLGAPPRAEAS
ncbi:5-dehydro-4-deoxy-D-glucuronate isomerase [Microcella sp.]|uniref:5-dehydro-4-deoxy-D-glucuronate isomerase n=1 Tax=Microcella sp. TaxID=1913979 RepID=UPI00256BD5A1|nr:5-dehydro-4-deoxy-D-glucuronate isomerase [Microcella sp.]MBX9472326.1 5-dehydro-4-deoxy-D-glucuronate isomerase [Microcella sp.]